MAKSDITLEQAQGLIDRVAQELGLLVAPTSGFLKVQGPTNRHRIYVQRSRHLGRIDFTIDLPADDPARVQLSAPNGSVKCHIAPDLEQLERCLRMLGDATMVTQVPNKPRPFAASKQPVRKPKAIAAPIAEEELASVPEGGQLVDRIQVLRDRARLARINRIIENPEKYGVMTHDEAAAIVDGKVDLAEVAEAVQNANASELNDTLSEAGIEIG